ncbi:MAG: winged helix-turn-helix transcriptional regulator [Pseudomonadota bacterium]
MTVKTHTKTGAYLTGVDQIADVWTFLILREAFFGARRFGEFAGALHISRARLTERLKYAVEIGLLSQQACSDTGKRQEYRLTDKGLAIYPIALALIDWAETWRDPQNAPTLIHKPCGYPLQIQTVCRACRAPVQLEDIAWPELIPLKTAYTSGSNVRGWRKMTSFDQVSSRPDPAMETLKAFGDRWSMLIIYGAMQGPFHFKMAQETLGLSTNILTDRLKHLIDAGLLQRTGDQRNASYIATPAGLDLFKTVLAIRTWATDWDSAGPGGWSPVLHTVCGHDLQTDIVCGVCSEIASPRSIEFL